MSRCSYIYIYIYIYCKLMFDSQLLNMKKRGKINSKPSEICRAGNEGTRRMLLNPTVVRSTNTQMSSGSSSKVSTTSDNNGEWNIVIALWFKWRKSATGRWEVFSRIFPIWLAVASTAISGFHVFTARVQCVPKAIYFRSHS